MTLPTIHGHTPAVTIDTRATVYAGNSLEVLIGLPDNSIDSIVTDPPYELGFMGKTWDNSGIAYNVQLWQECLRVLKPGGHILAFGGSRTWHRLAVAIDDAGFEIRDSIAWIYGSGFPKSLDISKAIDKRGGVIAGQSDFAEELKRAKSKTNLTILDLNEILGRRTSNLWSHFVGDVQPQLPSSENYWKLKSVLPIDDKWDVLFQSEADREVVGQTTKARSTSGDSALPTVGGETVYKTWVETAPATAKATQWQGWGTALKPAFEPVVVGRKPLIGTVAANVLTHGTGGLNIDGTRIGTEGGTFKASKPEGTSKGIYGEGINGTVEIGQLAAGRWPSNVILDETTAQLVDEQSDTGGASRFFYVAKASKRDRNEGLDGLEEMTVQTVAMGDRTFGTLPDGTPREMKPQPRQNFHPTVKPTSLMRQLIRLVTPPNGTVLDPFTGSGSTGKAAILENFNFVGVELTSEYLPIIEGRLQFAANTVDEQLI